MYSKDVMREVFGADIPVEEVLAEMRESVEYWEGREEDMEDAQTACEEGADAVRDAVKALDALAKGAEGRLTKREIGEKLSGIVDDLDGVKTDLRNACPDSEE